MNDDLKHLEKAVMSDKPTATAQGAFRTYGIEYTYDGKTWGMHVVAQSERDALARLQRAASYGKVIGELMLSIPATPGAGLLTRPICWWRNLWR